MKSLLGIGGVLIGVVWVACGQPGGGRDAGSGGDAGLPEAGPEGEPGSLPPTLVTRSIQPAVVGQPYADKITARHGSPPFSWSLPNRPAGLSWLSIDPARGTLSGVPPAQSLGNQEFTVQVQDSMAGGRSARAALVLRVTGCVEGDTADCFAPSGTVCLQGIRSCVDGGWGDCAASGSSGDLNACGPSCQVCGPSALSCAGGQCVCGAGPACSGASSLCCSAPNGSTCTDILSDPNACGGCGDPCDAGLRLNVARVCDGGICSFPCASSQYFDCDFNPDNGCETDFQSPTSCGSCFHACPKPTGGWATCDAGSCGQACSPGFQVCSNNCISVNSQNNCGGCGKVCPVSAPNTFGGTCSGGTCQLKCRSGFADCDSNLGDGCETNTMSDANHCGGCDTVCSYDGGSDDGGGVAACQDGGCTVCLPCGGSLCCAPYTCGTFSGSPSCFPPLP